MSTIEIRPATLDRFDDVEHALTGGGDGGSCWCQWWMLRNKDWNTATSDEKRELLKQDLTRTPAAGLVAYVDDEPAAWVKVAPRPQQPRLAFTKSLQQSPEPIDDESVWAVTCFVVRAEHRGAGLGSQLLEAAIAYARENGARVIEGYPIDTDVKKASSNALFHGALSTFVGAGFTEVASPSPGRPIVSLTLS